MTAKLVKQVPAEPLKQRDIVHCVCCRQGVVHSGSITFYRLRLTRYFVDMQAVQRQLGLEQMMGPTSFVAGVLGPDEDLALPVGTECEVLLCDACASKMVPMMVFEMAGEVDQ